MHGCMEIMTNKQHPFWARPCTAAHFCGASTHIGQFEEPRTRVSGHRGRTGAALDLGATLAGSFDSNLSKMRAFSDRPLTALGLARSGRQPIAIFRKRFFFLEKNGSNSTYTYPTGKESLDFPVID